MLAILKDLYAHQEWADAAHWRAVLAHGPARTDGELADRLFHIHAVQRIWPDRWVGRPVKAPEPGFASPEAFRDWAREGHDRLRAFLDGLAETDLSRTVAYRNLAGDPFEQPLRELMLHLPYHSQYHRGQSATRMVALGGHMPGTDLVTWMRGGRPDADWG
jgi:uncharacterized damage-inducible protein DinB